MVRPTPVTKPEDVQLALDAAQRVVETHRRLAKWLRPGLTLAEIDTFVAETLDRLDSKSCFFRYKPGRIPPFPSHACLSVNDCVVHGTAGYRLEPLTEGDLLKIDIGVKHRGWIGDAAWTYSFGEPAPEVRRMMECGKEALRRGVQVLHPDNTWLKWAEVVQGYVEGECKLHLVRGLGGHGYGRSLHAPPFIANVVPVRGDEWPDAHRPCWPGTLVAVEPMIALGTGQYVQRRKEWPIFTADGSLSVHYEHDVLVTEDGPRILTEGMEELPDVIG
jgi:methionyl aminopeptidase